MIETKYLKTVHGTVVNGVQGRMSLRRGSRITTDRFPKQGPRCKLLGAFYEAGKFGPLPGAR